MNILIQFLHAWQDLVGAFIGPFLAVMLSGVAFLVGRWYDRREKEKEAMRNIEISTSYSINSTVNMQDKLRYFVSGMRRLIAEIEAVIDPRVFAMQTINFPALGTIYLDDEMLKMPTQSYYIHNKLLWIHSGTRNVNDILGTLREDFARVGRLNEKMLDLMKDNPNPPAQREAYAINLTIFADEIERFSNEELSKGIKPLLQVKIYNDKLRKNWFRGRKTRWENEGVKSWVIRNLFGFGDPKRTLKNVDHIDSLLEKEVNEALEDARHRARDIGHEAQF